MRPAPTVIGIDDWAWRGNHRYGTIICDLERRKPISLLPDREPATAQAWLTTQPQVTVVARGRGGAYPLQTHKMLFDADQHAFRVLGGGVPRRGIYDNMTTAVDRICTGKARQVNMRFVAMASHYLFEPEFCNPASGWEKGQVEKNVRDTRCRLWQRLPELPDIAALNAWLEEQ